MRRQQLLRIGEKLKSLRESIGVTQGLIERRTGLARTYISRAEHGRVVPVVETLERWAKGLGMTMFEMFRRMETGEVGPSRAYEDHFFSDLEPYLARMTDGNRRVFVAIAEALAESPGCSAQKPFASARPVPRSTEEAAVWKSLEKARQNVKADR